MPRRPLSRLLLVAALLVAACDDDGASAVIVPEPDGTTRLDGGAPGGDGAPPDAVLDGAPPDDASTAPDRGLAVDAAPDAATPADGAATPDAAAAPADAAAAPDGAPGSPDAAPPPGPPARLRLNEVDCRGREFIEVINVGDTPGDLAGWHVTDDPTDADRAFPLAGVLAPGDLTAARRQTADEDGFTFGIACGGDRVTLLDPTGAAADAVDVPLQPAAYTWGRLPDGAGDWQRTDPTRDAPNAAPVDAAAALFDPAAVFEIDLSLRPEALEALAREPREYVPATLRVDGGDPEVGVHLKGRLGSFRELDAKAAFKVKINAYDGDLRLRGLKKLTLNNMVQDPSKLHEWTAYTLFRAMGVPAPRVGYAWVRLNGEGYGLYAHVETIDDVMLDRWLPSTGSLYEGAYGQDLFLRDIASLDRDEGDGDRAPLRALVDLLDDHAPADAYAATADRIDWPQVVALMVTEIYIGHWDGYAPTQNNFFLHFDDDDVLRLLPWGTDQTFDRHLEIHAGRGRLLQICLAAADCRRLFDETLGHLLDVVDALDLPPAIEAVRARLAPFAAADPRNRHDAESVADAVRRTQRFLADRRRDLAPLVECLLSPNPDPDGDGFICDADCDPNDGTIFPGAEDLCGDGIDQDCNGYVDDDDACPDCAELFRGGQRYLVCTTPRTWEAQQARCAEHGAELARPDDPAEAAWLYAQAIALRDQDYWLGLNDRDAEGVYVWADGAPLGAANWNDGEPNNAGNEDCVHLWARNGQWNDLPCEARLGGLCEAPCDPSRVDADGDGVHGCGEDCDDGDPGVGRCDE